MLLQLARKHLSFLILFFALAVYGTFWFKDLGTSWDEPFFYDYAASIRSAYDPAFYSSGTDPDSIYGVSAEDHKYYGPAYLLIAEPLVRTVQSVLHATPYQAWHFINFRFFMVGVLFFYILLLRWLSPRASSAATALFATQPLLIGHAFINPKDVPFLVFCLITSYFGIQSLTTKPGKGAVVSTILFGIFLGLTTSVRVIGPILGAAFLVSFLLKRDIRALGRLLVAGMIAVVVMVAVWPFLWADPVGNLLSVLRHMSNNPTELAVLYEGVIFRANEMPWSYIPKMMLLTLTEPVWLLTAVGVIIFLFTPKYRKHWVEVLPFLLVFGFIIVYILLTGPAVYDGFRHFLFILPFVFIAAGFAFEFMFEKFSNRRWVGSLLALGLLLPGMVSIVQLHPYPYTYYNSFEGGVDSAYRTFETDYWLTCYDEAIHWFEKEYPSQTLFIQRELPLAQASAPDSISLAEVPPYTDPPKSGYYLFSTRANLDLRSEYRHLDTLQSFGVGGAEFCLIKQVK